MDSAQLALLQLGSTLRAAGYHFITPTPETHRRVLARARTLSERTLTDIFGWSMPFASTFLSNDIGKLLQAANCVEACDDGLVKSTVRFSKLGNQLYVHSAFPTAKADAIFFGPDTYRFARALKAAAREDESWAPATIADIGAGSGAGGLFCATLYPRASVVLSDINHAALRFCEVNAALNAVRGVRIVESDVLAGVDGLFDLVIANPPYLVDSGRRAYRHGGGAWGCDLARRIVEESLPRLSPQGRLILYTGAPVVRGVDKFFDAVRPVLERHGASYRYEEIDPDVFGEELCHPPYDTADRIAVVMLLAQAGVSNR